MRNAVVGVVVLVIVFYTGTRILTLYKAKSDYADRVERALDFVENNTMATVAQGLVKDGQDLGFRLNTDDVHITFDDTDIQSYAQKLVAGNLGAHFKNKRVVITVQYKAYLLAVPLAQEVTKFKVRQVEAPQMPPSKETQQLLDSQ